MRMFEILKKRRIGTFIGAFILGFFIVEGALRLFGFTPLNNNTFDENNLVIFKPNTSFPVKDICYSATINTNSLGFHAKEYSFEKPTNTFRIVVLGDSFVEAAQVPLNQTFFSVLEDKLNRESGGIKYEVIPFGKSGHGTLMNLLFAREYAMRFSPDLVIEAFITNDLEEDFTQPEQLGAQVVNSFYDPESLKAASLSRGKKKILALKHFGFERSRLLEHWWMNFLVVKNHLARPVSATSEQTLKSQLDLFHQVLLYPAGETAQKVWTQEELALKSLSHFAQSQNTKFLLLHLSEGFLLEERLRQDWSVDQSVLSTFDSHEVKNRLATLAQKNKFAFFSTQEYFEEQTKKTGQSPVWKCDNHYNTLGHEWVAQSLYIFLTTHQELLRPSNV